MKYTNIIFIVLATVILTIGVKNNNAYAQSKPESSTVWYIGTNPVAIPLGFSIKDEVKRFLPIATGNEYGANVVGGFFFRPNQNIEGRLSLSNIHQVAFVGQFHLGTNYYFHKGKINNSKMGWYIGGFAKYWDFYNRQTDIHFHNISPYIGAGYTFSAKRFLVDLRINQTLAVYSWSSLAHTKGNAAWMFSPWPEFIPVIPTISLTISYKHKKSKAMNKHIFFDNLTASVGAMVAGKKKFFANSIQSPTFEEQVAAVELEFPKIAGEGVYEVRARTKAGDLDPAFCVAQWKGPDFPTIIYNHGNNERPFEFKKSAKNTFYNIFINTKDTIEANLIVVRAPFHNSSLKQYQDTMVDLSNFTAMIATSVKLNEELVKEIRKNSAAPVIISGISLGGWVTNIHRAIYNTSTAYAPLMAGTYLGELFIKSKYRKMASDIALHNPQEIRRVLNFDDLFTRQDTQNLFPLLSKYDQFIEYDIQKESYNGYPLKTIECGHVTGAINSSELRNHILSVLRSIDK
jgi:hypothetical protein